MAASLRALAVRAARPFARAASSGAATMRVARVVARSGLMSRRQADAALAEGRVAVDGAPASVGAVCAPDARVTVDGRRAESAPARVWLAYKKRGEAVARDDGARDGPPSVFRRLGLGRHVVAVGRLDVQSEGLLVLTTCGALARAMEHPRIAALDRAYDVRVNGFVTPSKIAAMRRGVRVDRVRYAPLRVAVSDAREKRATLTLTCSEGKNRMIRRICDHLRLRVSRLVRTRFGPFSVAALPDKNHIREVRVPKSLREYVGDAGGGPLRAAAGGGL